jgi:AcrR family transcriptional regulator
MEKFNNLPKEKQQTIINAAYKVFSEKGYKDASTNEIVKLANISKGLLFHYFKNKQNLYKYLFEISIDSLSDKLINKIDLNEKCFIKRFRTLAISKVELFKIYPNLFDFMKSSFFEEDKNIQKLIKNTQRSIMEKAYKKLYTDIDYNLFKDNLDKQKALEIITLSLEKWSENYMTTIKNLSIEEINFKEVIKQLDGYLNFFKKTFYK